MFSFIDWPLPRPTSLEILGKMEIGCFFNGLKGNHAVYVCYHGDDVSNI